MRERTFPEVPRATIDGTVHRVAAKAPLGRPRRGRGSKWAWKRSGSRSERGWTPLAQTFEPITPSLMTSMGRVRGGATTTARTCRAVAALLDVMQISEVVGIDVGAEGGPTFTRPIYAGNVLATVQSLDAKLVLTVRGTAFEKAAADGGSAAIEEVAGENEVGTGRIGAGLSRVVRARLPAASGRN